MIIHIALPDVVDQKIYVNGREWRFDFHRYLGPSWLKKKRRAEEMPMPDKQSCLGRV